MGSHWSHWKVQSSFCALAVSNGGRGIFPDIVLLVDCFEWALIGHIEKCRVHSVLWQFRMGGGGDISLYILISWLFQMGCHWSHWKVQSSLPALAVSNGGGGYFLSLYILISWLFRMGSHWQHWTAKSWLSALAVLNGGRGIIGRGIIVSLSALVFPYIFLLVDHFEWVLIGDIGQQRVDSVLWQFWMGGGGIIGRGIIVSLSALVFPYIFLLVDRFEWVLIGDIGQQRVDLVLWQFQMGGGG